MEHFNTKKEVVDLIKDLQINTCPAVILFYIRTLKRINSKDKESLDIFGNTLVEMKDMKMGDKKINKKECEKCDTYKSHKILHKMDKKKNVSNLATNCILN